MSETEIPTLWERSSDRPIWWMVLVLAWPALLQNWLTIAVNLSDRLLAGRFLGLETQGQTAAQAAQTTAAYLAWFLSCYSALVTVGATTLTAHLIGAGNRREAGAVLHQALLLAALLGLLGTVGGLTVLEPLLWLLQLRDTSAAFAADYLRPLLYQLPLQMLGSAGIACLCGAGDTRTGLWVLGSVALLNLPLSWVFCLGGGPVPALGFVGIAIGTAVSQALGSLAVLLLLLHGRAGLRLRWRDLQVRLDLVIRMLRVGIPAGVDTFSMQIGFMVFLSIINGLGDTAAAAHGVALAWESLGYQSGSAFGVAAITVVGQNLGAGRPDRAARGGWIAFGMGAALMSFMGFLFFCFAVPMFQLFCPRPEQTAIVATGVPVLRLVAFGMPALASCMILAWALRGAGDTRWPMLFTWIGFFGVRIPLALLLTGWLGLFGAWLAMCTDLYVRGLCVLWRFASGRWQGIRV